MTARQIGMLVTALVSIGLFACVLYWDKREIEEQQRRKRLG